MKTRASRTGEFASLMRVCARARVIFAARVRARARRIISPFVSSRIHGATRARDDAMTMNDDYDSPPIVVADASWRPLRGMTRAELRLRHTLPTGQSFRWRSRGDEGSDYVGVVGRRVVRARERRDGDDGVVEYKVYCRPSNETVEDDERVIREYFNADVELKALYETFSKADGRFRALASRIDGARTLRQDPSECLFSFICSSNNHISRIHGMVGKMCSRYGDALPVTMDDVARDDVVKIEAAAEEETPTTTFHAFPSVAQVIERATEEELRALGFGYRAKFIVGAAETLARVAGRVPPPTARRDAVPRRARRAPRPPGRRSQSLRVRLSLLSGQTPSHPRGHARVAIRRRALRARAQRRQIRHAENHARRRASHGGRLRSVRRVGAQRVIHRRAIRRSQDASRAPSNAQANADDAEDAEDEDDDETKNRRHRRRRRPRRRRRTLRITLETLHSRRWMKTNASSRSNLSDNASTRPPPYQIHES